MTATTLSNSNTLIEVLTAGRYFKKKYGVKVYKTPISIMGFTCPNIDGTVARGGCTYCENESFSPNISKEQKSFKLNPHAEENPHLNSQLLQLVSQYKRTKTKLAKKFKAKKFIVYFQSFSNTYAPFSTLKALYDKAFELEDAVGVSIGTRSDCMSEEILEYLRAKKDEGKEVWLEFGVQSIYNETLKKINRGHDIENVITWIKKTKEYGINVCSHMIFGLPNETKEMMIEGVKLLSSLHVDSLKIHPLYVTKNTRLAKEYKDGKFEPISEKEYLEVLVEAVKIMPKDVILQRITAGVTDESLLAPMWCYDSHVQKNSAKNALKMAGFLY